MKSLNKWSLVGLAGVLVINMNVSFASANGGRGGGFFKNSPVLLTDAATDLAQMIRNATASTVSGISDQWTKDVWTMEKFAHVIENIRQEPATPSTPRPSNPTQPVLLDFGTDSSGPYIVATKDYYTSFEGVNVPDPSSPGYYDIQGMLMTPEEISYYQSKKQDVEIRLIHEFSHLLGIGVDNDKDSDVFSQALKYRLRGCAISLSRFRDGNNGDGFFNGVPRGLVGGDSYLPSPGEEGGWAGIPTQKNVNDVKAMLRSKKGKFSYTYQSGEDIRTAAEIEIQVDSNGVIHFKAWDEGSGKRKGTLSITSNGLVEEAANGVPSDGKKILKLSTMRLSQQASSVNQCGDTQHLYMDLDQK